MNSKDKSIIGKIEDLGIHISKISGREVSAFCPKHEDTNPSFFFNLDTEKFHCFAGCICGRGLHQLIYHITGISQAGAVAREPEIRKFFFNRENDKKKLPSIPFLPDALNNDGEEYLFSRGFTKDTIQELSIKYWEEERAVVIPINNKGYVLRYIDKNANGKYKYVSGTRITETLFGLDRLPKTLSSIILVEGSLDCLWLRQMGFLNVLALLHADISKEQIRLLGGVTDYVYLMLDGDFAGKKASEKIKKLLRPRFLVKTCILTEGKDPAMLTKEEVTQIINEAK